MVNGVKVYKVLSHAHQHLETIPKDFGEPDFASGSFLYVSVHYEVKTSLIAFRLSRIKRVKEGCTRNLAHWIVSLSKLYNTASETGQISARNLINTGPNGTRSFRLSNVFIWLTKSCLSSITGDLLYGL